MSFLEPFFRFFEGSWLAVAVGGNNWMFPALEAVHIVALCMLFGGIVVLNLRLFGILEKSKSLAKLYNDLFPWLLSSYVVILVTGFGLFASESMKCFTSIPFQVKMVFLIAASLFHLVIYPSFTRSRDAGFTPPGGKLVALVSLFLWLGVGLGGRAIGFL